MSNGQVFGTTGIPRRKRPIVPQFSYPLFALGREEEFRQKELAQTEKGLDISAEKIAFEKELGTKKLALETEAQALTKGIAERRDVLTRQLAGETQEFQEKEASRNRLLSSVNLGVTGLTALKGLDFLPKASSFKHLGQTGTTASTLGGGAAGFLLGRRLARGTRYEDIGGPIGAAAGAISIPSVVDFITGLIP